MSRYNRELADQISSWIAFKVNEAKCEGVVFGLSGGIDSAVVAALCVRGLLSKNKILAVMMPCESQEEDKKDALLVANLFGIEVGEANLDNSYRHLRDIYYSMAPSRNSLMSGANLKARLRMATLYYIANEQSCLVVGTGNKTEEMIGYFTKYGDGACDILPLGDLFKTEVRELAEELEIPKKIIDKAPSAGFWQDQTDEDEIGIKYEVLDTILKEIEDQNEPDWPEGICTILLKKVRKRVADSQHKRLLPPMFFKSSFVAKSFMIDKYKNPN